MVHSQQVEDGGVQVVHVHLVFDRGMAEFIGLPVAEALLDAAAGEKDSEPVRVMVTAGSVVLGKGVAPELSTPPYEGVLEEPALFQVGEQARHRLVGGLGMLGVQLEVGVLVPARVVAVVGVVDLDVAHPSFRHPAGQQALAAEFISLFFADSVAGEHRGSLRRNVSQVRSGRLHPVGHLERFYGGFHGLISRSAGGLLAVESLQEIKLPFTKLSRVAVVVDMADG